MEELRDQIDILVVHFDQDKSLKWIGVLHAVGKWKFMQ